MSDFSGDGDGEISPAGGHIFFWHQGWQIWKQWLLIGVPARDLIHDLGVSDTHMGGHTPKVLELGVELYD